MDTLGTAKRVNVSKPGSTGKHQRASSRGVGKIEAELATTRSKAATGWIETLTTLLLMAFTIARFVEMRLPEGSL